MYVGKDTYLSQRFKCSSDLHMYVYILKDSYSRQIKTAIELIEQNFYKTNIFENFRYLKL